MAVFQSESGLPSSSHFPLFCWKKTFGDKLQGTESIQGKLPTGLVVFIHQWIPGEATFITVA